MVDVEGLSQQIRAIRDALELLEYQVREAGGRAQGFFAPEPHPTLISDWKMMIDAAASLALAADEILNSSP